MSSSLPKRVNATKRKAAGQKTKVGHHLKVTKLIEGTGTKVMASKGLLKTMLISGFICHHPK